jgi:hypothetical protein
MRGHLRRKCHYKHRPGYSCTTSHERMNSLASVFIPRSFIFSRLHPISRRTPHSHQSLPVACYHLTQPVCSLLRHASAACRQGSSVIRSEWWWVFVHGPGTVQCMCMHTALGLRTNSCCSLTKRPLHGLLRCYTIIVHRSQNDVD